MSSDKGTIHCLLLPNIHPRYSHTQLVTIEPPVGFTEHRENKLKQNMASYSLTNYSFKLSVQCLHVLTVEQLLRLGVALPGGGFCCTVKVLPMFAMSL